MLTMQQVEAGERRRSTRLKVHIPMLARPQATNLRWYAMTVAVNAHGCLLAMDSKPAIGTRLLLCTLTSPLEQSGTVVRVSEPQDDGSSFKVAFEFDSPMPDLWSLHSPPQNWRHLPATHS